MKETKNPRNAGRKPGDPGGNRGGNRGGGRKKGEPRKRVDLTLPIEIYNDLPTGAIARKEFIFLAICEKLARQDVKKLFESLSNHI